LHGYVMAVALAGCASPPPPQVTRPARDLVGEKQLASVQSEREKVEEKLSAVESRDRERCGFRVGDCQILVDEQRDELMKSEDLIECRVMPDGSDVTRCMADGLVKRGKHAALAAFFSNDVSCKQTVLACTDGLRKDARDAASVVRAGARERELHAAPRGAAAMNTVTVAEDEIAYLRATLPPSAGDACPSDAAHERCLSSANAFEDQFEDELEKDEFNRELALGLLERHAKAHSLCSAPEIACLSKALEAHGLYPEAKKWVTRNFDALERRQEMGARVSPGARARCLSDASKGHQDRIVNAYVAYSHEAVLFFRVQLDKAFLDMHESQLSCLKARAARSPSGRAAVTSN
jgi:hypothetical protein